MWSHRLCRRRYAGHVGKSPRVIGADGSPEDQMTMPSPQYQAPPQKKAGFVQRGKDRMAARAQQVVGPQLEPGEQLVAGLRAYTGPSEMWRLLSYWVRFFQRHYYLVITDRRVIFCGISFWTGRPQRIKIVIPRSAVQVSDYDPAATYPSFKLAYPERPSGMMLRTYGTYRPELQQAVAILAAGGLAQPGLGAPGYPPPAGAPYQAGDPGYQPGPEQYGAPPQQYGAPPQQYGAPEQYGAPQQYGAPPEQYGAPPQQYGAPQQHGAPEQYGAPQQQYQAPQPGYQPESQQYQPAPEEYDPPTVRYQPAPQDPQAPPPGSRRGRHAGG
jgi:hypothetical protein